MNLFEQAKEHYARGDVSKAETLLGDILASEPDHAGALIYRGMIAHGRGDHEGALANLLRVRDIRPDDADIECKLAVVYTSCKQTSHAVAAYQRAIEIQPACAPAHYNLGLLFKATGRLGEAESHFQHAVTSDSGFVLAHVALGNLLRGRKQFSGAENCYLHALARQPDNLHAAANLALVQHKAGKLDEAGKSLATAMALGPKSGEDFYVLGLACTGLAHIDSAISCLRRATELSPGYTAIWAALARAYDADNDFASASAAYEQALALDNDNIDLVAKAASLHERANQVEQANRLVALGLDKSPGDPSLLLIRALLLKRDKNYADGIRDLMSVVESITDRQLFKQIHHTLGQLFDLSNQPDPAMEHFSRFNQIVAEEYEESGINKNQYLRDIEQLHTYFRQGLPVTTCTGGPGIEDPIFLVGFPRSGTTLLDMILDTHPTIQTMEEQPAAAYLEKHFLQIAGSDHDFLDKMTPDIASRLRKTYFDTADRFIQRRKEVLLVDKLPLNIEKVHLLWRVFPHARFILAIRHPLDVCLSCYMQNFGKNIAMGNFVSLEDTALLYAKIMGYWMEFAEHLPINFHRIRYEDLVDDQMGESRALVEFLGLEWHNELERFHEGAKKRGLINTPSYLQVSQPIYRSSRFRWKRYRDYLEPVVPILEPYIHHFGYSVD